MTSDATPNARAEARSRGPVTAAGRAISAQGTLKHGLRARAAVLLDDGDAAAALRAEARAREEAGTARLRPPPAPTTERTRVPQASWGSGNDAGGR